MDIDTRGIASSHFATGALGAMVTAIKFTPGASWPERMFNVAAGSLAAGYGTPALVEWLQMKSPGYVNGAAFFVGLLGMSAVAALMQALKDIKLAEIISGWLSRR